MKLHWHPISTVLMPEFGGFASSTVIRMMLTAGPVTVRYAGDRMWPALEDGVELRVVRAEASDRIPGALLLVEVDGIPDVLRLVARDSAGVLACRADADVAGSRRLSPEAVLGVVQRPLSKARRPAWLYRALLELREAWRERPDGGAGSVLRKYDSQAAYYAETPQRLDEALAERLRRQAPDRGAILVAGAGAGGECFGLAEDGWQVRGVDFSAAMVSHATRLATERGLKVEFVRADLLRHEERPASLRTILFTYDVYSFFPRRSDRISLLRRMRRWLAPGGEIFLSARRVHGAWAAAILTLQWLAAGAPGWERWGDSHTRYVDPDGTLRRSFVHYFTARGLGAELRAAGLRPGELRAGHLRARVAGPEERGEATE